MLLIPLWVACGGGGTGCNGDGPETTGDCPDDLSVAANAAIGSIIELSFTTESSTSSTVTFGDTTTPAVEGTEHDHLLLGNAELATVAYTLDWNDGSEDLSCSGEVQAGGSSGLPDVDAVVHDQGAMSSERFMLLSVLGDPWALMIIDRFDGEVVWWYAEDNLEIHPDVDFVEGSNDLYFNTFSDDHSEDIGAITRIDILGNELEEIRTEWAHHAFTQIGDGTVAYMAIDIRDWYDEEEGDKVSVVGDAIWEFDDETDPVQVISSWDVLEVYKHASWDSNFYPQGHDWTHGNAMVYHPDIDSYLFSFGHIDTILEVDRSTVTDEGHYAVTRQYGGPYGISVADGSKSFNFQHDTNYSADGTLLMISTSLAEQETTCLEYEIDEGAGELVEVAEFGAGEGLYAFALGMCRRLDNGNTLVNYGSAGVIQEYGADGSLVWELYAGTGAFFGQSWLVSDLYTGE